MSRLQAGQLGQAGNRTVSATAWLRTFSERLFDWLSSSPSPDSGIIRGKLIQSVLDRKASLVVGSLCMSATALTAFAMTGQAWPLIWLAADFILVVARLAVIRHSERSPRRRREDYIPTMLSLGLLWTVIFASASFVCMVSGHTVLAVMAAVNTAGVVGAASSRNAPTPRYGALVIIVCCLPFAIGVSLAPFPAMPALALIVPLWAIGMYVIMLQNHDIAVRMIRAEMTTRKLALTDTMTGLGNRMCLDEELALFCADTGKAEATEFTLLCLDLDGFKTVNDRHGHTMGDVLLKAVGRRLLHAIRPRDQAFRNGGDEFAVILPAAGHDEATFVAKRIITSISRPFDIGVGELVQIGVSIGSVHAPEEGYNPPALLAAADNALYAAKRAGKGVHREHGASQGRASA